MQKTTASGVMTAYPHVTADWRASRRNVWIAVGLAVGALTALALGESWVTITGLLPLLYILPCAAMMLMCMKGMNHGQKAGNGDSASQAPAAPPSTSVDT